MFPDTRISLVIRLAETADVEAWQEFVDLYAPVLLSIARRKGLQPVDAEDLVQEILMAVARAIHRFEPDQRRAKFRSWLGAIARNLIADMLSGNARRPIVRAITDSWLRELESQNVETVGHVPPSEYDWITQEYRRSVFRVAAGRVQKRVNENTWQAFYLTKISQLEDAAAAKQLSMTLGALHVARCRVLKLLRAEVEWLESSGERSLLATSTNEELK